MTCSAQGPVACKVPGQGARTPEGLNGKPSCLSFSGRVVSADV